ncbi:hypothetical protein FKM82_029915 [Ascaphus truei]
MMVFEPGQSQPIGFQHIIGGGFLLDGHLNPYTPLLRTRKYLQTWGPGAVDGHLWGSSGPDPGQNNGEYGGRLQRKGAV